MVCGGGSWHSARMIMLLRRVRTAARALPVALGGLLVAAVPFATALPAAAAGAGRVVLRAEAPKTFVMYAADEGADGTNSGFVIPVSVRASDAGPARDVRVVVDASGLAGVARVSAGGGGNCTRSGAVFTCSYGDVQNGDGESEAPFTLNGVDGVAPGDGGTVTYTAVADNAAEVTGSTRMTVGGPSLDVPGKDLTAQDVAPGSSRPVTLAFANHSRFAARQGVALTVSADPGLKLTSRPGNCFFDPSFTSAWCGFATAAGPHTAFRTSAPIRYTTAAGRMSGTLTYSWSSDRTRPAGFTVRGTQAPLALARTADRGFTAATGTVRVTTTVQADYQPVTATVRGRVGQTVTVRLGVRNNGPGRPLGSETMGGFKVVPPEGTTVTSIPYTIEEDGGTWACDRPAKSGGAFVCDIGTDPFGPGPAQGRTTVIGFRVRIDRVVPGAQGTISTYGPFDRTPGNDRAVIAVDASPASPVARRHTVAWSVLAAVVAGGAVAAGVARVRRRRARAGA